MFNPHFARDRTSGKTTSSARQSHVGKSLRADESRSPPTTPAPRRSSKINYLLARGRWVAWGGDQGACGGELSVVEHDGRFELALHQPGLLRPLRGAELSDGTLRYLLWVAALLTPRPPALLVLNEPETTLHPELLRPLAGLIVTAATHTQIVVVTHSRQLAYALESGLADSPEDHQTIELVKENGATTVEGQGMLDEPSWHWPKR